MPELVVAPRKQVLAGLEEPQVDTDSVQEEKDTGDALSERGTEVVTVKGEDRKTPETVVEVALPPNATAVDLIRRATDARKGSFLHKVVSDPRTRYPAKVRGLFQAAVARRPSKPEIRMARELLLSHQGSEKEALRDLWWALLNSNEFLYVD